jgi:TolB-like protein/tetratricopeptide (TPR) repeat protein
LVNNSVDYQSVGPRGAAHSHSAIPKIECRVNRNREVLQCVVPLQERPVDRRKLAAILAADVAGYSKLMADDEVATVRSLNDVRDIFRKRIAAHGGRLIDTAGDSILAEFPSAVEAVDAAVEIQHELEKRNTQLAEHRRMQLRIGINLGDVIGQEDGTIYGDGVNVAARLQALAEPGSLCISGTVFDQVEGKLHLGFTYLGEQTVKNISRPVRAYASSVDKPVGAHPALAMPYGPVLAVLPFANLGGDSAGDYFADGITEDIITELARFRELHVLARNTTLQYKGHAVDVHAVGRKLGVHYMLEGSVRKAGNHVRINAQLIDVATGTHCWAERFDREMADIFAVQDQITGKIVGAIAGGGSGIVQSAWRIASQRKRPTDLTAYDLVLRAAAIVWSTPEGFPQAKELLEQAMALDPVYARPRHEYAWLLLLGWIFRLEIAPRPPQDVKRNAIESVRLDPSDALAHRTAAYGYFFDHQLDLFEREARIAFELAPYNAEVFAHLGMAITFTGQWERGVTLAEKGFALNETAAGGWYHTVKYYDYYRRGEYRKAIEAVRQHPYQTFTETKWKYIPAYGQLGELGKAREYFQECIDAVPEFSTDWMLRTQRLWNFPEDYLSHYVEGFAKAGYPLSAGS